jgi:hypothetical protein
MRTSFIISIFLLLFAVTSYAGSVNNDSLLTGTWKGTSICQVKPSPCNDEIAVYHITKGDKPNTYHIVANKVINGVEEDMGVGDYTFNPADNSLFCYLDKYNVTIKFIVKGRLMEGTLTSGKTLARIIKLKKEG